MEARSESRSTDLRLLGCTQRKGLHDLILAAFERLASVTDSDVVILHLPMTWRAKRKKQVSRMGTFDQKVGNQLATWKRHLQGHAAPTVSVSVKKM